MWNEIWNVSARWTLIPAVVIGVSLGACGPDRDQLARQVHEKVNREMEAKIKREVEKRLRAELPRLEARLRAQLLGKKVPGASRPVATPDPKGPADPKAAAEPGKTEPGKTEPGKAEPGKTEPAMPADPAATAQPKPDPKGLLIRRHVIANQVKERAAFGVAKTFKTTDGQVYCYLDAANAKGPERMLHVAWLQNGKELHRIRLRVGKGSVWRTWARLRLRPTSVGSWQCAVSNEDGQLISRAGFTVQ